MRIAFIGQKGIPMIHGGVEKHVEEVSVRLAARGHDVLVYTRPNYTPKDLKRFKGTTLVSKPVVGTKHLDAISHTFFAVIDVIFRRRIDVIHFHSIGPSFLISLVKIFKPRTPVVATFHSQCYNHEKWGMIARISLRLGEYVCCTFSDALIAVSKDLKELTAKRYNRKAIYVPNGVPIYQEKRKADYIFKRWGLEKDEYMIYVGRLIRVKGLVNLIKAYKKTNTYKKLVLVGDGSYTDDYVEELKRLTADDPRIIFTGRQGGKILEELYSNAYLAIQPSEFEGMSISLLEALSYGLPVVMSDIPGNKSVAGDVAFMFESKHTKDLQKVLQFTLDHPNVAKNMGKKGRKIIETNYNWEEIITKTEKIYHKAGKLNRKETRMLPRIMYFKKAIMRLFM